MMTVEWGTKRVSNMYTAWTWQLKEILRRFGMRSIRELVGRTDTLVHLDYYNLPVDDDIRRGVRRNTNNARTFETVAQPER